MPEQNDVVGDLLRDFYDKFGMPNEGPPRDMNVSAMLGRDGIAEAELSIIRSAVGNGTLFNQFSCCRKVVEDLASRLTGEELLLELSGLRLSKEDFDQLSSGVLWFSLASSLDQRQEGLPQTPFDKAIQLPLPARIQMTIQGSLVFRLFVALVYMREGALNDLICASARGGGACSARVKKLLNSDYVRRIRNSLAHGSFSSTIAGLVFRDDHGEIVATPGFLNWLCTWLTLIQLQALAASAKAPHSA